MRVTHTVLILQIVVLMVLLSGMLTWQSAMTGLGVTFSVIPLSIFVGRWQTRVRLRVVQCTDARVKLTGEVLSGMHDTAQLVAAAWQCWQQQLPEQPANVEICVVTCRLVDFCTALQSCSCSVYSQQRGWYKLIII